MTIFRGSEDYKNLEVDKIVNHKRVGKGYLYLVNWKGYSWEDDIGTRGLSQRNLWGALK